MNDLCPSCGTPTEPGAMFCDNCGAKLAAPAPVAAPAPQSPNTRLSCPSCGHGNMPGSVFCENCGQALEQIQAAPPAPPAPVPAPPPAAASISGQFIVIDSNITIPIPAGKSELLLGREDPVSQIFPEIDLDQHDGLNSGVSRRHAKVTLENGQTMLEDLNAVNYTHLNGQRLTPGQKYPLNSGDELMLGKLRLRYQA
ncbi:MAG: zinc-ribbon domain-containing protein [Anaerolineae bacterium]|nr:zinc-ribbon domain-containing protein [Anaerolineae bacterium]